MGRAQTARAGGFAELARKHGFTLAEMAIALAIVAVVASIGLPKYQDYQEQLRVTQAIYEINFMNSKLMLKLDELHGDAPGDLSEIGEPGKKDPWGRDYVYQPLTGIKGVAGKARKNKNLVPINTYYDLYSKGKDGQSILPLTAAVSRDDILLANDGRFVGMAKDYE
jgi:general secretion pathway protein G